MPPLAECIALVVLGEIGGIVAYHNPTNALLPIICAGIIGALKFSSPFVQKKDPNP